MLLSGSRIGATYEKRKHGLHYVAFVWGILCGGIGIYKYFQEKQAGSEYEKLKEEVTKK